MIVNKLSVGIIFTESVYQGELEKAEAAIRILNKEFGIVPELSSNIVSDADFLTAGREIFNKDLEICRKLMQLEIEK